MQYRVDGVHPTGLTVARGVRRCPHSLFYKVKFNKNVHKMNKYLTPGLPISRLNKEKLQKLSINEKNAINISKYRTYRNIYNRLLRLSKKCTLIQIYF